MEPIRVYNLAYKFDELIRVDLDQSNTSWS
jgi:hypothetical protein